MILTGDEIREAVKKFRGIILTNKFNKRKITFYDYLNEALHKIGENANG